MEYVDEVQTIQPTYYEAAKKSEISKFNTLKRRIERHFHAKDMRSVVRYKWKSQQWTTLFKWFKRRQRIRFKQHMNEPYLDSLSEVMETVYL